jgi:succinoglycan biosynthesis protein ExoA
VNKPSVSVIIPVLNGAVTIGDLLEALRNQRAIHSDNEIIVVDNGSTDRTTEIVGKYPVTLLEERKRGQSAARNLGLRHAKNDIIAHLDADMLPTRNWLTEIVSPFATEGVVIAGGRTICYRPETPAERFLESRGIYETRRLVSREQFPVVPSGNMAVRRKCALSIGGWAENMMTAEDADFTFRVLKKFQTTACYAPKAILFHRSRKTDDDLRRQAWAYGEGLAHMYLRYSDILKWDAIKSLKVAGVLAFCTATPLLLWAAGVLGFASDTSIEFSCYRRFWECWFWRGFASMYLTHQHSPVPEARLPMTARAMPSPKIA